MSSLSFFLFMSCFLTVFLIHDSHASASTTARKNPISHFIVLMMENRSFDHLLGWLKETNKEINGLNGNEVNFIDPFDPFSEAIQVNKNAPQVSHGDPPHEFDPQIQQIYGFHKGLNETAPELMNGFARAAASYNVSATTPLSMFTSAPDSAPIINTLATEFALFDAWHCSGTLPTDPNRGFAMSGTANGMITNFNGTLWSQQSYFNLLTTQNVSWKAFYDSDLWAIGYYQDMRLPENAANIHDIDVFFEMVSNNELPQFTWLQPRMLIHPLRGPPNWQHPDASLREGERLIKRVYEALRNSTLWNELAFVITYDEHGGFYDHVPPPTKGIPPPDGVVAPNGYTFDTLGMRIPSVVVSPWVSKGRLIHEATHGPTPTSQYEGTSNIATANKLFDIDTYLSERHKWAATFEWLFTELDHPRTDCPTTLPSLPLVMPHEIAEQAQKPLNDHLAIQVQFYCDENRLSHCPDPLTMNQGEASKFILEQAEILIHRLKASLP